MFGRKPAPRRIERQLLPFTLDDGRAITVEQVRDPRAKRLRLSVSEGRVRLVLPARGSERQAQRFLAENGGWVAIQLARQAAQPAAAAALPSIGEPGLLPLRGESVPLAWAEGRYTHCTHEDECVRITVGARAGGVAVRRALLDFYQAQARADVGRWLPRYLPDLPRAPRGVRFKRVSSIWGSLSPSGEVSLDLALVLGRPQAFQYVLVHELCHLIEHNHSPRFWREVEQRYADWRGERDYLRAEGAALKRTLSTLLECSGA